MHSIDAVIYNTLPGLAALLIYTQHPGAGWWWAYVAAFSAQLAIIGTSYRLFSNQSLLAGRLLKASGIACIACLLVGGAAVIRHAVIGSWLQAGLLAGALLACTALASAAFALQMPRLYCSDSCQAGVHRWALAWTVLAMAAVAVLAWSIGIEGAASAQEVAEVNAMNLAAVLISAHQY
jgi:hypothetical protein